MLKKGQVQDNLEMVIAFIIILIGVFLLYYGNLSHELSLEDSTSPMVIEKSDLEAMDVNFMSMDLLNLLRLEIDEYTVGEILASLPPEPTDEYYANDFAPDTDNPLTNYAYKEAGSIAFHCHDSFYESLNEVLGKVYGDSWVLIRGEYFKASTFICSSPGATTGFGNSAIASSTIMIPSKDPGLFYSVTLEVWG